MTRTNKYAAVMAVQRANGTPCAYCKRPMNSQSPNLMPTRDHTTPQSRGGRHIVWACYDCNHAKADMALVEWFAFMAAHPEWWKGTPSIVRESYRSGVLVPIPIAESRMILRHGKKHWREWRLSGAPLCDCCRGPVANPPKVGV